MVMRPLNENKILEFIGYIALSSFNLLRIKSDQMFLTDCNLLRMKRVIMTGDHLFIVTLPISPFSTPGNMARICSKNDLWSTRNYPRPRETISLPHLFRITYELKKSTQ